MITDAKVRQNSRIESEIEAKRAEIKRLRTGDPSGGRVGEEEAAEKNRDEANGPRAPPAPTAREESFGDIAVLWERPVDEDRGERNAIAAAGGERRSLAGGSPRRSTDADAPSDTMVCKTPCESEETSVASAELAPDWPSPGGLFEHLLRPFGPRGGKEDRRPSSPRQTNGFLEHFLIPLNSPGSQSGYFSEKELLKRELDERELTIRKLEETVSSDTEVMRRMRGAIERLSVELIAARRSAQLLQALGRRCSSLEDEVEDLRVENTKLRIGSRMLEEEKRRIEQEMRTELELLHLETRLHKVC